MIKVIACDMDGTLLDVDHKLNHITAEAIRKANKAGIRFMVVTGRKLSGALDAFGDEEIECDFILSNGVEIINSKREILFQESMPIEDCRKAHEIMQKYPVGYIFSAYDFDYHVGDAKGMEQGIVDHILALKKDILPSEVKNTDFYRHLKNTTFLVKDIDTLFEKTGKIRKIFAFSENTEMLAEIKRELQTVPSLDITASFDTNLEITNIAYQKGSALKRYIESLGYTMDEVMVFGDHMNDISMLSMDFGATVAMGNAAPEVKKVSKYVTKTNLENGVAYAIEELLKKYDL